MKKEEAVSLSSPKSLMKFAESLKEFIVRQKLYTQINGKNYVNVEGWQFAGGSLGLLPVVEFSEKLERENEIAYKASIAIYSGERIVSRGIAICSNKEANFIKKEAKSGSKTDEYVINSMAQTRAQGKAFRLLLGWLMKVAGYESTPAEEVQTQTATKEAEAVDVSKTLAELEKCLTMKSFQKTFNGLSKELKVNREVLKTAKKIKGLIEENEN